MTDRELLEAAADAADEIEGFGGIVPEVLEKLIDDLCSENERLRDALVVARQVLSTAPRLEHTPWAFKLERALNNIDISLGHR